MDDLVIRTARKEEVPIFLEWARDEGWNPGLHDGECHYAVDPAGWYVAESGGEVVGTVAVTNYDSRFSFGGFFVIREDVRSRGIGWQLSSAAIRHAGARNLGIDGVFEMQEKYTARMGFSFAYRNIRWKGIADGKRQPGLCPVQDVPFSELMEYDSLHFPAGRKPFLERWIRMPDSFSSACVEGGVLRGYGVIRRCVEGFKIGPLFADSPEIGERILEDLAGREEVRGQPFFFDTPEPNREAVGMARERGMEEVFGTARMYTREIPPLPLSRIFGVTSFEMG
ncbi:MAG: GNAT family N-acetyltransferase [Methanolinea sp.]|nr:GNAT family N-acetyltransferase [Methanolinea sp.]